MPDENLFDGSRSVSEALKQLRLRLLDLTARNRLLNFRPSAGKTIQIVNVFPNLVWDRLNDGKSLTIIPIPEPKTYEYTVDGARKIKPEVREHAKRLGINPNSELPQTQGIPSSGASEGKRLQALYYPEDLSRVCRKVHNHAKTAIEETGSNMLYLVFGFLEFYEDDASDKPLSAPLIAVPVTIKQGNPDGQSGQPQFELTFTGDEITGNLSLQEKLKQQFGIQLPDLGEDDSLEDYLRIVADLVSRKPRWKVKRQIVLSILSFAKMVLVNDLDPNRWPLTKRGNGLTTHELVKGVFQGLKDGKTDHDGEEYNVDEHPDNSLPLIYDADTYQHRALIDALAGKNMVINGPPGTGKSQTITNLVAAALQRGKKVLFISEKLAALQVVKNRLELAGLGKFVLELHSNKTNKKAFLEELDERMRAKFPEPRDLPSTLQALEQRRLELKRYADTLNSVIGNELGLTVHEVLWASEKNRQRCSTYVQGLDDIIIAKAPSLKPNDLDGMQKAIDSLARHFDEIIVFGHEHPWFGFFPDSIKAGDDLAIQQLLSDLITATKNVDELSDALAQILPLDVIITNSTQARNLSLQLSQISPFPPKFITELLPLLFNLDDPMGGNSFQIIKNLKDQITEVGRLSGLVKGKLKSEQVVNAQSLVDVQKAINVLNGYRLSELSLTALRQLISQVTLAAEVIELRTNSLETYATLTGIPLSGTTENLRQIASVVLIGSKAIPELLVYRHKLLGSPSARKLLNTADKTARELEAQSSALKLLFYFDERPDSEKLSAAISTLRKGDAWYRILQREWREAKRFYRELSRNKTGLSGDICLRGLESISQFISKQDGFNHNKEYKENLGALFKGESTDFDAIEKLVQWYEESQSVMFNMAIAPECFDLTNVPAFTISQLHKLCDECQQNMEVILPATDYIEYIVTQLGLPPARSIVLRISDLRNAVSQLTESIEVLSRYTDDSVIPVDTKSAIQDKLALDIAIQILNSNVKASGLLGKYFLGQQTATTEISASLEWGASLTALSLPKPLTLRILQPDAEEYLPRLTNAVQVLVSAWDQVDRFPINIAALGNFNLNKWNHHIKTEQENTASNIRNRAEKAYCSLDKLLPWAQYIHSRNTLESLGLGIFFSRLENGVLRSDVLKYGFLYRLHASLAQSVFRSRPELATFSTTKHNQIRKEFGTLDKEIIKLRGRDCAYQIAKATELATGTKGVHVDDYTECELLYRLIPQQRPRIPIRQILKRAGKSVQSLKPCFMMGPLAVAQYLEPGVMQFDLVVIDEASQLTPEEAIGALGRTKQIIVVGDPKQLPPTNFFNRISTTDDGETDEDSAISTIAGQESILDVCLGLMPERMLKLHYRSHHESLIAFSNFKFYDGKLVVFPSPFPRSKRLGLQYHHIRNGVYQNKQNQPEAMRVVDAIIDHMRCRPEESLGVCTLNMFQRDLIDELLEKRLKNFPDCDAYRLKWEEEGWPFFVKNLENVQGDERDVIFISTTFGKALGTTVVRQNFGPISRPTGWRRLNVLFTRARRSLHLYTSMEPEDIVIDQNTPEGTKALRGYLDYARTGILAHVIDNDKEPDSDFEISVADVLRGKGFVVRPQLGVAGYFIDMVVKHPNRPGEYIAAIECDGASYHSGTAVRDRDRIRQEILESLGWNGKIWRIWSTDWFRSPQREIQKLLVFLDDRIKECELAPAEFIDELAQEEPILEGIELDDVISKNVMSLASDDEELSVQVGHFVTFIDNAHPDVKHRIQIVRGPEDSDKGTVNEGQPLAQALLETAVGDEVEFRIQGQPQQLLVILKIERSGTPALNASHASAVSGLPLFTHPFLQMDI